MRRSFVTYLILIVTSKTISVKGQRDDQNYTNRLIYNDGNLMVLNEVVLNKECLAEWNDDIDQNKFIPPIGVKQIKCLMSVDRHCTKSMAHVKGILIKALKDGCEKCSIKENESVGKIVASMWAYDTDTWRMFLTKYNGMDIIQRIFG